jgi:integrase
MPPGKRPVPVPAAIMALLVAHREAQAVERCTAVQLWSDQGYIFADELGRAINPRTDWDRWKRLLAAADVRDVGCTMPATQRPPCSCYLAFTSAPS